MSTLQEDALSILKNAVNDSNLTQVELAEIIKVNNTALNRWLQGRSKMGYAWAFTILSNDKLAKFYNYNDKKQKFKRLNI